MNYKNIRKIQVGTPTQTVFGWSIPSLTTGEVYVIERNGYSRWQCSCPSPERRCKHIRRVEALLEAEHDDYPICT